MGDPRGGHSPSKHSLAAQYPAALFWQLPVGFSCVPAQSATTSPARSLSRV